MKTNYKMALTLLAGAALGAAAIQGLYAQAKPPVYIVTDITEVTDPEGFKGVGQRSNEAGAAVFKDLGGRYVMRTQNITAIDGLAPKRFIVVGFDSVEKAQAYINTPAQKEVNAIRAKTTKSRSFIVEGM